MKLLLLITMLFSQSILGQTQGSSSELNVTWNPGTNCTSSDYEPIQVHAINPETYVLRQSLCLNFEGTFMFLFLGQNRAILFDTAAVRSPSAFPLAQTVENIISTHLTQIEKPRAQYELIIAHTHSHGDHTAADGQFSGLQNVTVVGLSANAVARFFGLNQWPNGSSDYDLGERKLTVYPIPGHHATSIAVYDHQTQVLLTGDSLYPGRHYVPRSQWGQDRLSMMNLNKAMQDKPVSMILGCHIEMWTNRASGAIEEIPFGASVHSNAEYSELALELNKSDLQEMAEFFKANPSPISGRYRGEKFIIHPL